MSYWAIIDRDTGERAFKPLKFSSERDADKYLRGWLGHNYGDMRAEFEIKQIVIIEVVSAL